MPARSLFNRFCQSFHLFHDVAQFHAVDPKPAGAHALLPRSRTEPVERNVAQLLSSAL